MGIIFARKVKRRMSEKKIKVGIFFGGSSREREVSFAGGRTVYDNLDKELFDAIPLFVDSIGTIIRLNWEYVYRGTIRDFYPPAAFLPQSEHQFQVYAESLTIDRETAYKMASSVGKIVHPNELSGEIDVAFLALHGEDGEDGRIQGILEWFRIPYTGSGILPSAIGIDKAIQKSLMERSGFNIPDFMVVEREDWFSRKDKVYSTAVKTIGFPLVVKAAHQGSSIGVTILTSDDKEAFFQAMGQGFFTYDLEKEDWESSDKTEWVRRISDIRGGLGCPLYINGNKVSHPEEVLTELDKLFSSESTVEIAAEVLETHVVIESMLKGKEFSCIVIEDENGDAIALPPTEIVKGSELFDYRSKYLPGLSRKVTPIDLPEEDIQKIRTDCQQLYSAMGFNVYARIDGFYTEGGEIYLNDPNTTSGMMPSSFFFHQAAEIGLNPSQFLTYLIRTSLRSRKKTTGIFSRMKLANQLDHSMELARKGKTERIRVAVIMGGYSTERHISVESGRNIFEKLSSSVKYEPVPVFLTGGADNHQLYILPVNIMLKDNADDIKHKVENYKAHPLIAKIIEQCSDITARYVPDAPVFEPKRISYEELANTVDEVFIALHGRPGEDGAVQQQLNKFGIPYNGSGVRSSQMTINKYETNNLLREKGFLVAGNHLVKRTDWEKDSDAVLSVVDTMGYPLIAKPVDEGCSSAVIKIDNAEDLKAYAELTFRGGGSRDSSLEQQLGLDPKEEFPAKDYFLLENFVNKEGAKHFLEITGGMLTHFKENGEVEYEVFEPSEALAEGAILSLAEKFLAGEGQNITPARFSSDPAENNRVSEYVRQTLREVAKTLQVEGYCRIDAFVRIWPDGKIDVIIIEINSLPGMTPATCIYHQAAINGYKPYEFIDGILTFGKERNQKQDNE